MTGIQMLNIIRIPVLVVVLYLSDLENTELVQIDKNRILIYSK